VNSKAAIVVLRCRKQRTNLPERGCAKLNRG
jgi:hypothetical protein